MTKFLAALLLAWATLSGVAAAYDRDIEMRTLTHAGVSRSYGVYLPAGAAGPAPLIIALHGRYSSAKALHAISGLAALAEQRGAILLYPETQGAFWNDGGHAALQRREAGADDAGFIEAAIAALGPAVDASRVYLVGYDTGGSMAFHLACGRRPYAGVAVVSALMWDYAAQACVSAQPTSLLIVHGREDDEFPVRGGALANGRTDARRLSTDQTLAFWRERLGCAPRASASSGNNSALYACASGAALGYVGVARGAHEWFRDGDGYALNRHRLNTWEAINGFFFDTASFQLPSTRASGRSRSWITYVPPNYDPAQPMPLVIVLHGRPSTAATMAAMSEMNAVAARRGFIAVYPEGIDNEWNAYFDLSRSSNASLTGNRSILPQDDVGFLRSLAADVRVELNIDPSRMYVAGFSNGGFMTMRMACSASDTFAGFAEVGSSLYLEMQDVCRRSPPSPILLMHGSADPSIPYEGVTAGNPEGGEPIRITLRVIDTVSLFARRNGCGMAGRSTTFGESGRSPGTHVVRFVPNECTGAPLEFYQINGGGHTWPGVPDVLPAADFGPTNMDIHASEVIWDFFSRQTLARRN